MGSEVIHSEWTANTGLGEELRVVGNPPRVQARAWLAGLTLTPDFIAEQLAARIAKLESDLAASRARCAELEKALSLERTKLVIPPCSVCAGSGTPVSGRPCICDGEGTASAEMLGLRKRCIELENAAPPGASGMPSIDEMRDVFYDTERDGRAMDCLHAFILSRLGALERPSRADLAKRIHTAVYGTNQSWENLSDVECADWMRAAEAALRMFPSAATGTRDAAASGADGLKGSAQNLLDVALRYRDEANKAGVYGAVIWLQADNGALVVITRSEYRETLMQNIHDLGGAPMQFGSSSTGRLSPGTVAR